MGGGGTAEEDTHVKWSAIIDYCQTTSGGKIKTQLEAMNALGIGLSASLPCIYIETACNKYWAKA